MKDKAPESKDIETSTLITKVLVRTPSLAHSIVL